MYQILTDADVLKLHTWDMSLRAMEKALRAQAVGTLVAPPRFTSGGDEGALVFTMGAETDSHITGFRVYNAFGTARLPELAHLVAVWDTETGAFKGVIVGMFTGGFRTAALNAVALKRMARADAQCLGVLGSGIHARLLTAAAVAAHPFTQIKVYSPNAQHCNAFVQDMGQRLNATLQACASPEEVVRAADVLFCITTSETPVFDPSWLKAGTHIHAVGRKFVNAHELPMEAAQISGVIVTDSLAQVDNYAPPYFLLHTPERARMIELSQVVVGNAQGRTSADEITLFCSVGLAGTEVVLADEIFKRAASQSQPTVQGETKHETN